MRGKLSLHTVLGLIFVLVFMPTIAPAAQDTEAKADRPQGPVKELQQTEQSIDNKHELNIQLLRHASSPGNAFMKTLYINNVLSKGANVNAADEYGLTPLHHAINQGHRNIAELLIAQGARLDMKDNAGRTALHYAAGASFGSANPQAWTADIVQLILDNGANVDAQDNIGWTPLHYSALMRNKAIVNLLVDRGADLNVVNNRGDTPYSLVQERISYWSRYLLSTTPELTRTPEVEREFL
jgi:ankyrin repeat protein